VLFYHLLTEANFTFDLYFYYIAKEVFCKIEIKEQITQLFLFQTKKLPANKMENCFACLLTIFMQHV